MKKFFLIGIAMLAIGAAAPARAADMPVKAVPMVAAWSWTGFYVGLNAGYSWGRSETDLSLSNSLGTALAATSGTANLDGFVGGGQLGYNWQNGQWVLGLEADLQFTGQKGDLTAVCPTGVCTPTFGVLAVFPGPPVTSTLEQKLEWFGTLRARGGLLVTPTILAYVTGGLAYGEVQSNLTLSTPTVSNSFSTSSTKAGWVIGAGIEGVLFGNWTGKVEYLYMDLGSVSGTAVSTIPALGGGTIVANFNSKITDNILRVGLNYQFGR